MKKNNSIIGAISGDTVADLAILSCIWMSTILVVIPLGDFPLDDDWVYGLTVKHLVEQGDFRPGLWASAPFLTNVLWGAIFTVPHGFSFTALRFSTLTLSLAGILGVYLLLKDLNQTRWLSISVALTVAFNPIYYAVSNTFMTDIPFAALLTFSCLFLVRNLKSDSQVDLAIGTIFAIAAILSRQLAIAIPIGYVLSAILLRGFGRKTLVHSAIPFVLSCGTYLLFTYWLSISGKLPLSYHSKLMDIVSVISHPNELFKRLLSHSFVFALYYGLFILPILPILIVAVSNFGKVYSKRILISATIVGVVFFALPLLISRRLLPLHGDTLDKAGIGPLLLKDAYILNLEHLPSLPSEFWGVVTVLSIFSASLFLTLLGSIVFRIVRRIGSGETLGADEGIAIFLLSSSMIYLLPLTIGSYYDRYLIPVLPILLAGLIYLLKPPLKLSGVFQKTGAFLSALVLAGFCLYSVLCTKDYLAWNRVRWEALEDLIRNKAADAREIDGGMEFNGLHFYEPNFPVVEGRSWWWVHDDKYVVAFGSIPGYRIIKEYSYQNFLPPQTRKIVVLQKE